MKLISSGCSYTDVWVSPKNWQTITGKKALSVSWYVECVFYDPNFKDKYPKGFPFRKRLNKLKTLQERRAGAKFLLNEIPILFEEKGFNPITKTFTVEEQKPIFGQLHPDLNFLEALEIAYLKLSVQSKTKCDIKSVLTGLKKASKELNFNLKIKEIHSGHIRDLIDNLQLGSNRFNKYLTYLSMVFSELVELRIIFHNPIRDIKKRKVVRKVRDVLETDNFKLILEHLKKNYYTFYRYAYIFFFSGTRTTEMFQVQKKDVDISKQEFKVTILKGGVPKEVIKVILPNSLPFWNEIISECTSDEDYLFAKKLKPGPVKIQSYQITRRWKRLIKDQVCFKNNELVKINSLDKKDLELDRITEDFYSLKHSFLDSLPLEFAQIIASHTKSCTTEIYRINSEKRKREILKNTVVNF